MKHVALRLRAGCAAVAALCFMFAVGSAAANGNGAATLEGDEPFFFAGQFTDPTPVLVPGNSVLGCPSAQANVGGLVNCKYFTFIAGTTGTATLTIQVEPGFNFIDAAVHCNGEAAARAVASSNAGEPGTVSFPVVAGDVCEIRVSIFLADIGEATPLNPLAFAGSVTLAVAAGAEEERPEHFDVDGGGEASGGRFSVVVETDQFNEGTTRWVSAAGCESWSQKITAVSVAPAPDGWIAKITGYAKVRDRGVTTTNVPFEARAEDHWASGAKDRFHHNLCGGVDAAVDDGGIEIRRER